MTTTGSLQDQLDLIENPESRIACVIVVDVSGSMQGEPIDQVNQGLMVLGRQIEEDELTSMRADIAIVAFHHEHQVVRNFGQHVDFSQARLSASGGTRMAPPIDTALDMIEKRKIQYRDNGIPYYRPIIMLITDGYPEHDSSTDLEKVAKRIKEAERKKNVTFFSIGTEQADMKTLANLSSLPPKTLRGVNFVALFEWLSNSITAISQSQMGDEVDLPSTDGWSKYS